MSVLLPMINKVTLELPNTQPCHSTKFATNMLGNKQEKGTCSIGVLAVAHGIVCNSPPQWIKMLSSTNTDIS